MSYRSTILSDYPIGYYPLDDLTTVDIANYTSLENSYATYQEILDDPLITSYASIYGDIAYDHSGCENDAIYGGDPEIGILPIVVGNSRATKITNLNSIEYSITKDYTATETTSQLATLSSSDNDFTLEAWVYPKFTTTNITPIFGDLSNGVGLFYDKGNILFKMDTEEIFCTVPYLNKVLYVHPRTKNPCINDTYFLLFTPFPFFPLFPCPIPHSMNYLSQVTKMPLIPK
jgi:hypothetical protein